ncbi:MAG: tyrosine-type recombinase/integrase [Ktedonobacteraceae bacterium]
MQNNAENVTYLDKFTVRKVQMGFSPREEGLPDSLAAWIETYLRLAVIGVRSEEVAQKIALHLHRFQDFFVESYGHDRLSTCLRRDVQAWQNALISQGFAHSTINNHVASLSAFTTWVHTHHPDLFPVGDPAKGVGELGLPPLEPRALSPEQVRSLKSLCDRLERFHQIKGRRQNKGQGTVPVQAHGRARRDRAIVYVLLSTGLRREELVNLDLDQIEPSTSEALRAARRARITHVKGKGKTERTVFLSADARLALADYLERERPRDATPKMTALFVSANSIAARAEDGRLSPQAINLILTQIGRWHDAEMRDPVRCISPLRPHDLRHTFAFHLAKVTGADAYELERRLGHRSQRYIQRYTNPPEHIAAQYVEEF